MEILALIKTFLVALPELIRLIRMIQDMQDEAAKDKQVKEDLGKINDAFAKKDGAALSALFNS